MSKTFCPAHWTERHVSQDGTFRGCCVMQGVDKGILRTNGMPHNVKDGIHSAVNSDVSKELRLSSLTEEWHPNCVRCKNEEAAGLYSHRNMYVDKLADIFTVDDAVSITDTNTGEITQDHSPVFYDLNLGNLCNLKCRICNPKSSSSWIPDWIKLFDMEGKEIDYPTPSGNVKVTHKKGKQYDITPDPFVWINTEKFWNELLEESKHIRHMLLTGGEPLMIPQHYEYIKKVVDAGLSKNMRLEYNTNLTNIHEKWIDLWKNFHLVYIGFSIDGMGKEFEYQRHPAKWSHMLKNIKLLDAQISNHPSIFEVRDAPTVNIYNVLHILDYHEWKIKTGREQLNKIWKKHNAMLGTHALHAPSYLSVKLLPIEAKKIVTQRYLDWEIKMHKWIDNLPDEYSEQQSSESLKINISKYVDKYVKFINQDDWSKHLPGFWRFNNKMDAIRSENFAEVFPELNELLTKYS